MASKRDGRSRRRESGIVGEIRYLLKQTVINNYPAQLSTQPGIQLCCFSGSWTGSHLVDIRSRMIHVLNMFGT